MAKKQLVVAFFEYRELADTAAVELKQWDKANKDIKLGAVAVLSKDDQGRLHTHKVGQHNTKKGAALGILAAALTGGASLAAGAVAGGLLGALFHKGLGISKDEMDRIDRELNGGKAMLGTLANSDEVEAVSAKLTELGGVPGSYEVSDEAIEQAEAAVETMPDDTSA